MIAPRVLILGLLLGAAPLSAAPAPRCPQHVDVRDLMTVSQFDRAGLDKLDKKQLQAFNAWLSRYVHDLCAAPAAQSAGTPGKTAGPAHAQAATTAAEAAFGKPKPKPTGTTDRIVSHLVGKFHGWTGDTVFRLKNGQVWKQAGPGYFRTELKSPKVVIKKLLIGYVLQVDGYGKEVFVRRIR